MLKYQRRGFTIVELLIEIVIIAMAAMTVVAYSASRTVLASPGLKVPYAKPQVPSRATPWGRGMTAIREEVARALDDFQTADREARDTLTAQRNSLDEQKSRLVDLAAEGQLPIA